MRALLLCIAACGGPPGPVANLATPEVPIVDAYCPPLPEVGPFAPELFRACPGPPFHATFALCAGKACVAPCSEHHRVDGGSIDAAVLRSSDRSYRYDPQGRYLGSDKGDTCTWDAAGHMGECEGIKPVRAADGLLVGIETYQGVVQIRYDNDHRVSAVGKTIIQYDAAGAITRVGELAIERDHGRVAREKSPDGTIATYRYDLQNRVIAKEIPEADAKIGIHVDYDGDRVRRMYTSGSDMTSSSAFEYDHCLH